MSLYTIIHMEPKKCMLDKDMESLSTLVDCYGTQNGTYLHIYDGTKPPHILTHFITKKVVLHEIAYQVL